MKTQVGVIFGGRSTEHEISVISANQAMHAFDKEKYDVVPLYLAKDGRMYTGQRLLDVDSYRDIPSMLKQCREVFFKPSFEDNTLYTTGKDIFGSTKLKKYGHVDVIVPVLHGSNVEDGVYQGLLQTLGVPFAGCDVLSSANGMDKITMKMILSSQGIPVVDYVWLTDYDWQKNRDSVIDRIESELGYPVIVKPANLGSSVGIGKASDRQQLIECVNDAEKYSSRIIVEHLIENLREINCSVLGDCEECRSSVPEEPIRSGEFLSYSDKYLGGGKSTKGMQSASRRIPADLDRETTDRVGYLARETFRVLGCHGVSRIDLMMDENDGKLYVNEINTIPGSLSFYLWEASGLTFTELMNELVRLALKRNRHNKSKTLSFDQNIFAMGSFGSTGKKGAKAVKTSH
ncbi:MAG: D-alanine--D-alanine ligase [Muribaculaceae bacterium]|nr:D-alanine--D-alanine ligase [Muribaculaceae bacterium]